MNDELVQLTPKMGDISPEYQEILMLGNVLHKSGYFRDIRDQAQAVTKILWGKELGFTPIVSLGGIHIIEGKPALSSNLMATLIKRSGRYDYRVKVWTDTECTLTFREKNGAGWEDVGSSTFTIDDAKRANVVKPGGSWSKYPKAMLFARALSQGLRTYCPDVSAAPIYSPEEMGATVDEEGAVVELPKSARPVEVTSEPIEIGGTGNSASGAGVDVKGHQANESAPKTADVPPLIKKVVAKAEEIVAKNPIPPAKKYITSGQATNLHREFRGSVPPAQSLRADDHLYQWLIDKGYVNSKGEPSAGMIPADDWFAVKDEALKYARSL